MWFVRNILINLLKILLFIKLSFVEGEKLFNLVLVTQAEYYSKNDTRNKK